MSPVESIRRFRWLIPALVALGCLAALDGSPAVAGQQKTAGSGSTSRNAASSGEVAPLNELDLSISVDVALPLNDFDVDTCFDLVGENHFTRFNRPANCVGPATDYNGRISMGVQLDGVTQYLWRDYDPDSGVLGQGEASFDRSLKFKIDQPPIPGTGSALIWSTSDSGVTGMYIILLRDPDDTYSYVRVKMSGVQVNMAQFANRIYDDNAWHHLRVTYDGEADNFTVTLDNHTGDQQTSATVTSVANTQPVYIGRKPNPQYYFNGCLADLYCLNGSNWTPSEASKLAASGIYSTYPFLTYYQSLNSNQTYLMGVMDNKVGPSLWKLDEESGARLDSIGSNDLTQYGDVGYAPGILRGTDAAWFDGTDDYLERPSADCVGIDELLDADWTLSFWIYFDALPSANGQNVIIVDKTNPDDNTGWEACALGTGTPDHFEARVRNGTDYFATTLGTDVTNEIITGCWYHYLFEYEHSTLQYTITINNEISKTGVVESPGIVASSNPFIVGCSHGYSEFLEGRMQQVTLFPSILGDNQKDDLYNFGFGMPIIACPADVNDDGTVNIDDLFQLLGVWGVCWFCPEDINGDGKVNIDDLFIVLGAWGLCP